MDAIERFWAKVDRSGDCWLWKSSVRAKGHGRFWLNGRDVACHRFAWELVAGPIPDGGVVCHTCDNPACTRNDDEGWYEVDGVLYPRRGHLWLGTVAANNADRHAKGRYATGAESWFSRNREKISGEHNSARKRPECLPRGERNGSSKLTRHDVRRIREMYIPGKVRLVDIARDFGVNKSTIGRIVKGQRWVEKAGATWR